MTTQQEWTAVGRFVAVFVKLFTIISNTFKEAGLGIQVVEWLTSETGAKFFTQKMGEIAEECKKNVPVVIRVTGVPRRLQPRQMLEFLDREPVRDCSSRIIDNMPGRWYMLPDQLDIIFFQIQKGTLPGQIEAEYVKRDLLPADPYSVIKANQDNRGFAETRPNGTYWKGGDGELCVIEFFRCKVADGDEFSQPAVFVGKAGVIGENYWVAGVPMRQARR